MAELTQAVGDRTSATPLLGRTAELAVLAAQWGAVCAGQPRLVLIEGPAGIGKTALLDNFLAEVMSAQVLRASGDASERTVGLGVVDQLLRLAGLPAARLLEPDVSAPERERSDHVRGGTLVLDALDRLQGDGPVVVALDDAHWADALSLAALLFAFRRLAADRVLMAIVTREDDEGWIPQGLRRVADGRTGATLRPQSLDEGQLAQLAGAMGVALPRLGRRKLHAHTGGNPLYARELLAELPAEVWSSAEPLPAPASFAALVARSVRRATPRVADLLQAVSILGPAPDLTLVAQLGEVDDPLGALDDGPAGQMISVQDHDGVVALTFAHPLLRAAVYDSMSRGRRAQLHLRAAELLHDDAVALRHRAAAAVAPDAGLARELSICADRATARGDWAGAVEDYRAASSLSPERELREERLLRAIDAMIAAGQVQRARAMAGDVAAFAGGAWRDTVLGTLAHVSERPDEATRLLESAWCHCDPRADPRLALRIALRNATYWFLQLEAERAIEWTARGRAVSSDDAGALAELRSMQAVALGYLGRFDDADRALEPLDALEGDVGAAFRTARGQLLLARDDAAGAIAQLRPAGPAALRAGMLTRAAVAFTCLSRAEYASGAWDDAVVHASRAAAIVLDHEHAISAFVWDAEIAVPAARGEWDDAAAGLAEARRKVIDSPDRTAWLGVVAALPAVARGDAAAVVRALEPVAELAPRAGVDEPGFWPWQDLYADGLVSLGRTREADRFLARHEAVAAARGRHSAIAKLARVRGRWHVLRGEAELAERSFAAALDHIAAVAMPYEEALIRLAYGAFMRRSGRRRLAAEQLQASRDTLAGLEAMPALERCERELQACGVSPVRREGAGTHGLSGPERTVAKLVADGLSNREVATELVLSVKTVEFHLTRVYAKLGIRSRAELAVRVARGDVQLGADSPPGARG